jgi:hypothetical protein
MIAPNLGLRLRDRLGPEASHELTNAFEEVQNDMLTITTDRFEGRLIAVDAGLRIALTEGLSQIRAEMSEMRADLLRWSFLFWIGQVAATAAMLGVMLRLIAR